jgi:ABC-type branched-subunit amino acid transport system substrate-binding protein
LVKIENIFRDDRANPKAALREARSLIFQKEVDFLIGGATKNTLKGHRRCFPSQFSSPAQGCAPARYVAEKRPDLKKWYIMEPDYAQGHDISRWFWNEIKRLNPDVEVIGEARSKSGTSEFDLCVTTIMAAKLLKLTD